MICPDAWPTGLRAVGLCSALLWAAWPTSGGASDSNVALPTDGRMELSAFAWADPAETAALLEELNASGTAPVAADLEQIGWPGVYTNRLQPVATSEPSNRSGRQARWRGSSALRHDVRGENWLRSQVRLSLRGPGAAAVARLQRAGDEGAVAAGYVVVEHRRWRLFAGTVGWHHGFGLICAGPSRWRSLGAAVSLAPGSAGPSGTYAAAQSRSVLGGQVGWRGDTYGVAFLAGRVPDAGGRDAPVMWGRVSAHGAERSASLLIGRAGAGDGFSMSAAWRLGGGAEAALRIEADAELAAWRDASGHLTGGRSDRLAPLWAARVRVAAARCLCEGQIAGSRRGNAPAYGMRPAALPRHDGSGWAVRGRWRPTPSLTVSTLLAGSRVRETIAAVPADRHRADFGLELEGRPAPGWRLTCHYRWRGSRAVAIVATEPWAPPREAQRRDKRLLAAYLRRHGVGWMGLIGMRSVVDSDGLLSRRRSLCESRAEVVMATNWLLRVGWAAAWGDNVDLISVAAPLPQLSTLRHWGRWREEVTCGVQRSYRRWHWQAAGSLRRPDRSTESDWSGVTVTPPAPVRELWLRVTYVW